MNLRQRFARSQHSYAVPAMAVCMVLIVLNVASEPGVLQPSNWPILLAVSSPFVLTAVAQAPAVLSGNGGIDLSVGPFAGLTNAVIVVVLVPHGLAEPYVLIPAVLALGAASGALNGLLVAYLRVPAIVATLGTYLLYAGLTLFVLPTAGGESPAWLASLTGFIGPLPGMLVVYLAIAGGWLVLMRTAFRRNLLAVGGDARTAFSAGIDVRRVRLLAFVLAGLLAATAGLAMTAVIASGDPLLANRYTLVGIAGVALGGVSFAGGRGGLAGAAAGGLSLFLLHDLLSLYNVSIFQLQIVYGLMLFVALWLNRTLQARARLWRPVISLQGET